MGLEIPKALELEQRVFNIKNVKDFTFIALEVYHFQFANNPLYQAYCKAVSENPENIAQVDQIPFLPISFFKTHLVKTTPFIPVIEFKSSGTTGSVQSTHSLKDLSLYEKSFTRAFEQFYGNVKDYCILGLLPSYLEKGQSSLVYMVDQLIKKSENENSGFYLNDFKKLHKKLSSLEKVKQKTLLIGVTYALLDFAERYPLKLENTFIMETGGMKGRGKEMVRSELYERLQNAFGINEIHSEYGMTELLSQAYSINGIFKPPPWMKIMLRDETDPLSFNNSISSSGAINVIDLANIYSCSFIATEDLGKLHENGSFEVLGRMDNSDIRGCSLLIV